MATGTTRERFAGDTAMDRYALGEPGAFDALYDVLAPRLWNLALRHLANPSAANDLVQQTFLQIHLARGRFILGAPVLPWAFAIAHRLIIDGTRSTRKESLDEKGNPVGVDLPGHGDRPDEVVDAQRVADRLRCALERLPEKQRFAFTLIREEGFSYADAAQTLGTTVMSVKLRMHRAMQALRAELGDFDR